MVTDVVGRTARSEAINVRTVLAAFAAFVGLMLIGVAVPRGPYVLVIGWPGTSEARMMQIVAAAGGSFVGSAGQDWLAVVHSEHPGLVGRLIGEGAMMVIDHALAAGCTEGK
jgi:ATP-dependent 26S proteasome regulatory subunit